MEQIIRSTSPIDANLAASLIGEAKSAAFKSRAIGIGAARSRVVARRGGNSVGAQPERRSGNAQGRAGEHAGPEGRRDGEGRWRGQDGRRRDREAAGRLHGQTRRRLCRHCHGYDPGSGTATDRPADTKA